MNTSALTAPTPSVPRWSSRSGTCRSWSEESIPPFSLPIRVLPRFPDDPGILKSSLFLSKIPNLPHFPGKRAPVKYKMRKVEERKRRRSAMDGHVPFPLLHGERKGGPMAKKRFLVMALIIFPALLAFGTGNGWAQLKVGDEAPSFSLPSSQGKLVDYYRDYYGKHHLVMTFFPAAFTPV
jgi:hypothetical protein